MKRCVLLWWVLSIFAVAQAATQQDPATLFRPSLTVADAQTAEVRVDIDEGNYLYRHRFAFKALTPGVELGEPRFPAGHVKQDEFFGQVETYRGALTIAIPLKAGRADAALRLAVTYQGCADAGVCYPPQTRELTVGTRSEANPASGSFAKLLGTLDAPTQTAASPAPPPPPAASAASSAPVSPLSHLLDGGNLVLIVAGFFGAGILLAFTPCMLPMLPILSGIVLGHDPHVSRSRAAALASVYVLGMALAYALAGVAAGLSGTLLATVLQNPWVLSSFAVVFVVLAGGMFGFYELQLPAALQSRLSTASNRFSGGHYAGVALMGVFSALIVGPCVAPPLAGALLYIARTGNALLGGFALFALALGMGAPLIVMVSVAREALPRSGPWMESVRKVFGVMLLAVAIWVVSPVWPAVVVMLAWAVLAIVSAIFLHALDPLPTHASGWQRFWKALGVMALLWGAALLIGVLGGARDPLEPLGFLRAAQGAAPVRSFEKVTSVAALDRQLAAKRPVMLDFYAQWCTSCKEMERFTFSDTRVREALKDTLVLQADVTESTPDTQALLKRFGLFGPPAVVFFDARGQELKALRVDDYQDAARFLAVLQRRGG